VTNIAIIGAGQIGSRHLQAIARLGIPLSIDLVDPSDESIGICIGRFNEIRKGAGGMVVNGHGAIDSINRKIDICIVSTSCDVRAGIIRELLEKTTVGGLILEKILFNRIKDYYAISELLMAKNIPAWVNCYLRSAGVFRELKEEIGKNAKLEINVKGAAWGMGSAAVHFIDLLSFLSGTAEYNIKTCDIDFIPSKRKGFHELSGTIEIANEAGSCLNMTCEKGDMPSEYLTISTDSAAYGYSSWCGDVARKTTSEGLTRSDTVKIPFQSETTNMHVEMILNVGKCLLPTFEESARLHLPFIRKITEAYANKTGTEICPLT